MQSGLERSDKYKDECGVVAIHTHAEASTLAYLGLHQLQHRGQESAGIFSISPNAGQKAFLYTR